MSQFIVRNTGRVIHEERVASGIRAAELRRLSAPKGTSRRGAWANYLSVWVGYLRAVKA